MTSITDQKNTPEQKTGQSLNEITPIIIKGCKVDNAPAGCFIIEADSCPFTVEENFGTSGTDWIISSSQNPTLYIQSIVSGQDVPGQQQICETSQFTHPLTVYFIGKSNDEIFKITEKKNSEDNYNLEKKNSEDNYNLEISVSSTSSNSYFAISPEAANAPKNNVDWTESTFTPMNPDLSIQTIEVYDSASPPQLVYSVPNPIFPIAINLEPIPPQPK